MSDVTRREVLKRSVLTGAAAMIATPIVEALAADDRLAATATSQPATRAALPADALRWLEPNPSAKSPGITWGVPWKQGECHMNDAFVLAANGSSYATQTWPLAYWPGGSVKWTAHAAAASVTKAADVLLVRGASPSQNEQSIRVEQRPDSLAIDTGTIQLIVDRGGSNLIRLITRGNKTIATDVRLVAQRQDRSTPDVTRTISYTSRITDAVVEQSGPIRAVVKITGVHAGADKDWLPFVVRLYVYVGSDAVRMMHTFIFDGDQQIDFISALGVTAKVPMQDTPIHDRHVRFAGPDGGLWAEAVRNLSGLRRDPGRAVLDAQLAGKACPPTSAFAAAVRDRLELIPAWGDVSLRQLTPDSFEIRKRTKGEPGIAFIHAANGSRAEGLGYVGSPSGGLVFGLRDFWQRYPTQLDLRNAHTGTADVTVWMYSPDGPPMDLRGYHDAMGMDTFAKQTEGLNITYEDWEPGFSEPFGIARSSELMFWAVESTPAREEYADYARALQSPPLLVCGPERYRDCGVFGGLFDVPDRSVPVKAKIEDALDWQFEYYPRQRDERRWYGFWDYGDVRHTYDADRHEWRYDVGGYAWDNSELSPDLWLWYSFLRTGRADIFRFAEAMMRHTGEVDVYHAGRFKGLGSRHNVLHWGDSAKQLRISTSVYRRFYYYLTADERVGDLMRELVDCDRTFLVIDPIRKIRVGAYEPKSDALQFGFGTDWGSVAVALLAEWERTQDAKVRDKLLAGVRSIGAMPHGFFTSGATYDLATGAWSPPADKKAVGLSHLNAVFGLLEICAELVALFPEETAFRDAWLQYCVLYSATPEERRAALGNALDDNSLTSAHSRLTAYAAKMKNDPALAARAWKEFVADAKWAPGRYAPSTTRVVGPAVLNAIDEAPWVSTNDAAQWGLAAIQNLALIGNAIPNDLIATSAPGTASKPTTRRAR